MMKLKSVRILTPGVRTSAFEVGSGGVESITSEGELLTVTHEHKSTVFRCFWHGEWLEEEKPNRKRGPRGPKKETP